MIPYGSIYKLAINLCSSLSWESWGTWGSHTTGGSGRSCQTINSSQSLQIYTVRIPNDRVETYNFIECVNCKGIWMIESECKVKTYSTT